MQLEQSTQEYEAMLRKFMKQHPDATADDLKALLPKAKSAAEIWAKFNSKKAAGVRASKVLA